MKMLKDGDEIYSYYLREFYYMNVETKEEQFANVAFHVYEDQTTNTSHYLYANKRNISEISIKINKDLDGKCTEYKNYILNNTNIGK